MSILDWFDIRNVEHLQAYRELERTGAWPEGFLPENVTLPNQWQIGLVSMMASAYLEGMIN